LGWNDRQRSRGRTSAPSDPLCAFAPRRLIFPHFKSIMRRF
jgi:hypothetical protein